MKIATSSQDPLPLHEVVVFVNSIGFCKYTDGSVYNVVLSDEFERFRGLHVGRHSQDDDALRRLDVFMYELLPAL